MYIWMDVNVCRCLCTRMCIFYVYECMREVLRWRVFEKLVLRRIFGPKREEVTGGWRRLHNEELPNL